VNIGQFPAEERVNFNRDLKASAPFYIIIAGEALHAYGVVQSRLTTKKPTLLRDGQNWLLLCGAYDDNHGKPVRQAAS